MSNWWKHNYGKVLLFIAYSFITGIYSWNLNVLNESINGKKYLDIITKTPAIEYFLYAVILVSLGILYLSFLYRSRWQIAQYAWALSTLVILAVGTLCWIVLIIYLIQNPILRAIFAVYFIAGAALNAFSS